MNSITTNQLGMAIRAGWQDSTRPDSYCAQYEYGLTIRLIYYTGQNRSTNIRKKHYSGAGSIDELNLYLNTISTNALKEQADAEAFGNDCLFKGLFWFKKTRTRKKNILDEKFEHDEDEK